MNDYRVIFTGFVQDMRLFVSALFENVAVTTEKPSYTTANDYTDYVTQANTATDFPDITYEATTADFSTFTIQTTPPGGSKCCYQWERLLLNCSIS